MLIERQDVSNAKYRMYRVSRMRLKPNSKSPRQDVGAVFVLGFAKFILKNITENN